MIILIGAQIASADESSEDIGWSSPVYIQGIDDLNLRGWVCNPVQDGVRFCYGRTDNLYYLKGETTPQNNTVKAQPYFIVRGSLGTNSKVYRQKHVYVQGPRFRGWRRSPISRVTVERSRARFYVSPTTRRRRGRKDSSTRT